MKSIRSITPRQHKQSHHALTNSAYQFMNGVESGDRNFNYVDDNVQTVPELHGSDYRRHDLHTLDTITSQDNRVTFRTFKFIPKTYTYNGTKYHAYDPQGLIITSRNDGSAKDAYIAVNATSSDDGDINFKDSDHGNSVVQFIRINMHNNETIASTNAEDFMAGPPINLEHGQTNALNTNGEIIVLDNREGTETHGGICKIDRTNLHPSNYGEITFNMNNGNGTNFRLGDDFCGLSNGNYLNVCPNLNGKTPLIPKGALMLYWITFDYTNGVHAHLYRQYIRHAGGGTIQGLAENPNSRRVTVLYDDGLLSFPEDKLGHLEPSDFKQVVFNDRRESEGLAYDNNGIAYFLTDRSPEIMISRDLKDF